ncbi:MAG: class II aldolase/adducin family protein [Betaproteobacteria bacterium]|jgi:HCOMODA/2-hydroxy-3-carboxy-muconic semialdehyde decarboxylase
MNKKFNSIHNEIIKLVAANRVLANEGIVDAYGHVSIRNPLNKNEFLISRSLSPELVTEDDIYAFTLDGNAVESNTPTPYLERFIHGSIYNLRTDINAVIHSHADEVLPFTISETPLQPVIHTASDMGHRVPVWDIRDNFGDTNLLVTNEGQGHDLAVGLADNKVILMRGHGFTAAGRSLIEVVKVAIYLPKNAQIQLHASKLGKFTALSKGEIDIRSLVEPHAPQMVRAWEYWCSKAGVNPGK